MIKLLIVEDEPLIQIGIRSMLNWGDFDIEVCGIAKDGIQALEYIEKYSPAIIITDIKMPRMDGLELMKVSRERFGKVPVYIILTSYEEFQFLKEAMQYEVVDYLVKLELSKENLTQAIGKALAKVKEYIAANPDTDSLTGVNNYPFQDKFFIKLLLNLYDNEEEIYSMAKELKLDFSFHSYIVSYCEIIEYSPMWETPNKDKLFNLYNSTLQMVREIALSYIPCYVISLDAKHFAIIFCLKEIQEKEYTSLISDTLDRTFSMIHNYFNVNILAGIGDLCHSPLHIPEAYQEARQVSISVSPDRPMLFYKDLIYGKSANNTFNMSLFREDIKKAFEEFDTDSLTSIFEQLIDIFKNHQAYFLQSIDAACNILFLAISLLPGGEETVAEIFRNQPDGYRSIYRKSNVDQVIDWLVFLRDGLCSHLTESRKTYSNHVVANAKSYISSHIREKLSLQGVASLFGISPNYLSYLFRKYNDTGFNEYITQLKITESKRMMHDGKLKIYEIADQLGFENAFYFSKVFKKVEGCSPKEFMLRHM